MATTRKPKTRDGFTIAIICALTLERDAVMEMLDEHWEVAEYRKAAGDANTYSVGRIGQHNVVVARLPGMGTGEAASTSASFRSSFTNITLGLVVGICGGVPTKTKSGEILMGDVILSTQIIDFTSGRQYDNRFGIKDTLADRFGRPNREIRGFLGTMEGRRERAELKAESAVNLINLCKTEGFESFQFPGVDKDIVYPRQYRHKHQQSGVCTDCTECQEAEDELKEAKAAGIAQGEIEKIEARVKRAAVCVESEKMLCEDLKCDEQKAVLREYPRALIKDTTVREPEIHFGIVGSGNSVVRSGYLRDELAKDRRLIAFEMEGAGVWDNFPTVVIKAVCDYADSHKSKLWQDFAAASAAACMKALLMKWPVTDDVLPSMAETNLPAQPTFPVHTTVERPVNTLFTGRTDVLSDLKSVIRKAVEDTSRQELCHIVISGMGGQGKSEICLQLAHQLRSLFWGIFWIDVSTTTQAENGFLDIANRLDVTVPTWEAARRELTNVKQPWFLVLDNADDPAFDYQPYFPVSTFGVVILTSRNAEFECYATEKWIDLQGLAHQDASDLLVRVTRISAIQREFLQADIETIVQLLGWHPLALIQAGSYIRRGHCSLQDYPQVYERQRKRLLDFRPIQAQSRYGNVYATFEASAETLRLSNTEVASDALQLLPILAIYGPNRLPVLLFKAAWEQSQRISSNDVAHNDLLKVTTWHLTRLPTFLQFVSEAWDSFRLVEALNLLKAFSLILIDSTETSLNVSIHPLIHAWARDRLSPEQQHTCWVQAGCIVAISSLEAGFWVQYARQLQSHLQAVTLWSMHIIISSDPPAEVCRILVRCGHLLKDMRDDRTLLTLMHGVCTYLNLDHFEVTAQWIDIYYLTALSQHNSGLVKNAVRLLEQVVKIREQTLAEDHPDRLASQDALAQVYRANGQVREAVTLLEQVVKIREQTLAEDHSDRLASQHALAQAYEANGQVREAVMLLEQVVKIEEQTLAEDHPDRLTSQHSLAQAYKANGQVREAVMLLEQVVKIEEQTLAEDHPDRLTSQHTLAQVYRANGQVREAVTLLEQVVKIHEQTLVEDHPSRLTSQLSLAQAYEANGQVSEAVTLLEQVVKIREQTLAEDHPSRLASQHSLAQAYEANGQVREAVMLLEQVVKIEEQTLAEDHPDRLTSQLSLAQAYKANGQVSKAVMLLEQVVKIREQTLAEDHPDRLTSQHSLAQAYEANRQVREAVMLLEQVVKIEEQTLAEDHPDRLTSQQVLATCLWKMGDKGIAIETMRHVVKIRGQSLSEDHPNRVNSQKWLDYFETKMNQ